MSFRDENRGKVFGPLKASHFEFPRAKILRKAFVVNFTNYCEMVEIGEGFEAHGLLLTGASRVGKTDEIRKLIAEFNASNSLMPDGRPARIVRCILAGTVTWKDLGLKTLKAIGYEISGSRTQDYIWGMVLYQVKELGIIGIQYDECQHVFTENPKLNKVILDSFKSLMKEDSWPLMLILSGVPILETYIAQDEQLSTLLDPVRFDNITISRDMDLLNSLMFAYADLAGVEFEKLSTPDFLERIDFACVSRWGLVIELMIATLVQCRLDGKKALTIKAFAQAFALKTGGQEKFSPFTDPYYRDSFDAKTLFLSQARLSET